MVIRECVWDVCVYISCTGDRQLWSSFVCKGRGGWVGQVRRIRVRACVCVALHFVTSFQLLTFA